MDGKGTDPQVPWEHMRGAPSSSRGSEKVSMGVGLMGLEEPVRRGKAGERDRES